MYRNVIYISSGLSGQELAFRFYGFDNQRERAIEILLFC